MRNVSQTITTIRMPRPCGIAADRVRAFAGVPVVDRIMEGTGGAH